MNRTLIMIATAGLLASGAAVAGTTANGFVDVQYYGDRSYYAQERTEDRARLWGAQTPQVFRTEALRAALAAAERPEEATDEAMLFEWNGGTVLIHPVEAENLKVTTPLDLRVAELLLEERF